MFLQLAHTRLDVFQLSRTLTLECYKATRQFPPEEKFALTMQIGRAVLSVHLNIAEGCSRKSLPERKRFFEVSRGSVIEVDTALDVATALNYCTVEDLKPLGEVLTKVFKILSVLINNQAPTHH
jgi:four helix bundle protein